MSEENKEYPIRYLLGTSDNHFQGMLAVCETPNGKAIICRIWSEDFHKIRFTDEPSRIILKCIPKLFSEDEWVIENIFLNRHSPLSRHGIEEVQ